MNTERLSMEKLKLLPRPRSIEGRGGCFRLPERPALVISSGGERLAPIVVREWGAEFGELSVKVQGGSGDFSFHLGASPRTGSKLPEHPEALVLVITADSIAARARTYRGLVWAWQTLKQILRHGREVPCLRIRDWPDLAWRVYHLDLKGTRRRLSNLHAILAQLSEFKINAVLVEYEDYLRLDRHPDLAVPEALSKVEVKAWIRAARDYGIEVIPLVQTLGHLQYVLSKPAYADLQETPGDPSEACSSHPGTWSLVCDFLDEIIEVHPDAPFIHIGLDETFHIATCPRCAEMRGARRRVDVYLDWLARVTQYVKGRGMRVMAWGDMIAGDLDPSVVSRLDRDTVYVEGGYVETGPLAPHLQAWKGGRISREWLQRPNGEMAGLPDLRFRPGAAFYEDLAPVDQELMGPFVSNPEFPRQMRTDVTIARLVGAGLQAGAVAGIRVSFHGCVAPRFITGQLNTLAWAAICKRHGAQVLVGSSWSRGHSLAGMNAHPELDWYGIAALGAGGWHTVEPEELRDLDARFAFQFFGLEDGHIGDLLFLWERTATRVDHVMSNYLPYVAEECCRLSSAVQRNRDRFELLQAVTDVQLLRFRAQFAVLEMEYFYAMWERVPAAMKERICADIQAILAEFRAGEAKWVAQYGQTIVASDAQELVATQLDFFRDNMLAMAERLWGMGVRPIPLPACPAGDHDCPALRRMTSRSYSPNVPT